MPALAERLRPGHRSSREAGTVLPILSKPGPGIHRAEVDVGIGLGPRGGVTFRSSMRSGQTSPRE